MVQVAMKMEMYCNLFAFCLPIATGFIQSFFLKCNEVLEGLSKVTISTKIDGFNQN